MDRLLTESELSAERMLHIVRGVMWLVLSLVLLFVWGMVQEPLIPLTLGPLSVIGWLAIWQYLRRSTYKPWLKYLTITLDTLLVARLIPAYAVRDQLDLGGFGSMSPEDVVALVPLGLVVVIVSAALRLSPRGVIWATTLSVLSLGLAIVVLRTPAATAGPQAALLIVVGGMAATASTRLRDVVVRARKEEVLAGYVPTALIDELARAEDPRTRGREEVISVLFADIRGYTALVEPLSAAETLAFLNDYFAVVVTPVVAHGGAIDKYIGDGLLAFFEGEAHAERAVAAGRQMLEAVTRLNETRTNRPAVRIGVAVHTGPALIGTVGAPQRRDYTVLGDTVNVAARLEEMNKTLGTNLLISGTTRAMLPAAPSAEPSQVVPIRGRAESLEIFALA